LLRVALDEGRTRIEAGIVEAERELEECRKRCLELEALIRRGRVAIGESADSKVENGQPRKLFLHEAMLKVLHEVPEGVLRAGQIAERVNAQGLYRQRDGGPATAHQVHARVFNYPNLFERTPEGIRARP